MRENDFNLIEEPWVKVIMPNAETKELSMLQVFNKAADIKALAGELPTQDVAVLRLLLAVLHTVFSRFDQNGLKSPLENVDDALDRWQAVWQAKTLPINAIESYLMSVKDSFWLFDEKRPFFQVPGVKKTGGTDSKGKLKEPKSIAKLNAAISESGNKKSFFANRAGKEKESLSNAEAARWLIHLVGFDDSSLKKSDEFKKKEKAAGNKKDESPGLGWLGKLGIVYAEGTNLFETLMLNLVLWPDGVPELSTGESKPIWEQKTEEIVVHEREKCAQPGNLAELYTFCSRQIILSRKENEINGFYAIFGKFFSENFRLEQMTMRSGEQKTTKTKEIFPFQPKKHDRDQFFWQEFNSAFITGKEGGDSRPGVVKWLSCLKAGEVGIIDAEKQIRFRSVCVFYDKKNCSIEQIQTDVLDFHAGLISELGKRWLTSISEEIKKTEKVADYLGYFAKQVHIAKCGSSPDKKLTDNIKSEFYLTIDTEFRKWLAEISVNQTNYEEKQNIWQDFILKTAKKIAKDFAANAGPAAYIGREVKEKIKGKDTLTFYSAAKAYNFLLYKLSSIKPKEGA